MTKLPSQLSCMSSMYVYCNAHSFYRFKETTSQLFCSRRARRDNSVQVVEKREVLNLALFFYILNKHMKKLIYAIENWLRKRCKYLTKHDWQQVTATEEENQIAWRIGVHCMKEMHQCKKCGRRGWLFPNGYLQN
jgi:hypothetical protein